MNALSETIEKLQETTAALSRLEAAIAKYPDSPSLAATIRSLRMRQSRLEEAFATIAERQQTDVCSYRLFANDERQPPLLAITTALGDFQSLFTSVYDSQKQGPKSRSKASADVIAGTSFGLAYTYTGSVGVVLTLPNERLLLGESDLDNAMATVFEMAKSSSSEQIAHLSERLGAAPIRKLYKWALDHVCSGLGADVEWRKCDSVQASLLIQTPELDNLCQAIAETSDEENEEMELIGEMVGADIQGHRFHMRFPGAPDMRGYMTESIGVEYAVELPRRYRATIRKTTKINYATGEEDVSYYLLSLAEAHASSE